MNYSIFASFDEKFKEIFALTGGIGCGKSTVLNRFWLLGCEVIESDKICHDLYFREDFINKLLEHWGNSVITKGAFDKKKLANIVFGNKRELDYLNSIVHPEIFKEAFKIIEKCDKNKIKIFDIPLLFELNLENYFKGTIAVWTDKKRQYERLKKRDDWTEQEINQRILSQLSSNEKLERATYGIINTGSLDFLNIQCKYILTKIKKVGNND